MFRITTIPTFKLCLTLVFYLIQLNIISNSCETILKGQVSAMIIENYEKKQFKI